jgi:peptide/nickel transport system substrate-binding protein
LPVSRYWQRQRPPPTPAGRSRALTSRARLSRRRFLSAAALGGAALTTAGAIGCGTGGGSAGRTTATPRPAATAAGSTTVTPGGSLRLPGFEAFVFDTLDPHQTQFGPVYSSHSAVFSKLLRYTDTGQGEIGTDLATSMPEVVDGVEYIIHLRPGVKFQRPSLVTGRAAAPQELALDGRELTAHDVVFSIQRQINADSPRRPFFFRAYQYSAVQTVEAVDDYTVRIVLSEPLAVFLHALADTNGFIIAREQVDADDKMNSQEAMLGSGPFIWDELQPLIESRFLRNPDWFGWDEPELARPYIEGYTSHFLADDATLEATFRTKRIDAALQVNNPQWVRDVRDEFPEVIGLDVPFAIWLNSRLLVDRPPFSDLRLRRALHLAVDRQQIADSIFRAEARIHGPVSPVLEQWRLPPEELATLPGYRSGADGREEDIAEAHRLYEEAGSPPLTFVFADQPAYVPNFSEEFAEGLRRTLGAEVKVQIRSYVQINEGLQRGEIASTFQFDNGWIEPDDWLYPFFHSSGPKNSFRVSDPDLDSMLDAQRREFDLDRRRELIWEIQRYLLNNVLARLDYVTPTNLWVAWPYFRNFAPSPFFGETFRLADAWLDSGHPSIERRAD